MAQSNADIFNRYLQLKLQNQVKPIPNGGLNQFMKQYGIKDLGAYSDEDAARVSVGGEFFYKDNAIQKLNPLDIAKTSSGSNSALYTQQKQIYDGQLASAMRGQPIDTTKSINYLTPEQQKFYQSQLSVGNTYSEDKISQLLNDKYARVNEMQGFIANPTLRQVLGSGYTDTSVLSPEMVLNRQLQAVNYLKSGGTINPNISQHSNMVNNARSEFDSRNLYTTNSNLNTQPMMPSAQVNNAFSSYVNSLNPQNLNATTNLNTQQPTDVQYTSNNNYQAMGNLGSFLQQNNNPYNTNTPQNMWNYPSYMSSGNSSIYGNMGQQYGWNNTQNKFATGGN